MASNNQLNNAGNLAERLRRHIVGVNFNDVTISIGVAQWHAGESRRTMLERTDKTMCQAKQNGRNRVEITE